jgi:D-sedoheptulose 7-phosphate isomerase
MGYSDLIKEELEQARHVLEDFLQSDETIGAIEKAADVLVQSFQKKQTAYSCGNGGSACDAAHFAEELMGKFREDRDPYPAVAINDPSYLTCVSNDLGYERVFSRFLRAHGRSGDVLLAISTSGNSQNVINAAELAKQRNIKVIALTGNNGGALKEFADVEIRVPHNGYADRIQEIHIKVIHILILLVEEKMK